MTTSFAEELLTLSGMSAEFGYLIDHGRATECAKLFAADARLIFGPGSPRPGTIEGIEAIREFLVARQSQTHVTTRHQATNFRMQRDGAEAELQSLLTLFRSDEEQPQPVVSVVADIHERFVRSAAGEWLIRERRTLPIFIRAIP
jgi:hypothetical protein